MPLVPAAGIDAKPDPMVVWAVAVSKRLGVIAPIPRPAARLQDFPVSGEGKNDTDGFTFVTEIVELDPARGRCDLLKLKGVWRVAIEPGSPVFFQLVSPPTDFPLFAFAQKTRLRCVQIKKRHEIAASTGIQPVDDNGHLIEIVREVRHIHLVAPGWGRK